MLQPRFEWFQDGKTPDFIKNRQPCTKNPRSYIILTKNDTGYITAEKAEQLLQNFMQSSNDDMFLVDTEFSLKEKEAVMRRSQSLKLGFRHFGVKSTLSDHYVCIFKKKSPAEILEEARALGGQHPKYNITWN